MFIVTPMKTPPEKQQNLRHKNRVLLVILLVLIALMYGLSFVKFSHAVYG